MMIFGFPLWACISLFAVFIAAAFTVWLYLVEFRDDEP